MQIQTRREVINGHSGVGARRAREIGSRLSVCAGTIVNLTKSRLRAPGPLNQDNNVAVLHLDSNSLINSVI